MTPTLVPAPDLFAGEPGGLFADVVFDRPLDHAYTYRVPPELAGRVGVGKRVEAPFGRGDTGTVGYCVRVSDHVPGRAVKALTKVLDDDALLDDQLLRLTRWMADYYLCGWGQVLHAVVPAGARDMKGTRLAAFVDLVPPDQRPDPLPTVSAKQKQVLTRLREAGHPLEVGELSKLVGGTAPVSGLVTKGLLRKFTERIDKFEKPAPAGDPSNLFQNEVLPAPGGVSVLSLTDAQQAAWDQMYLAIRAGGFRPFLLHGVTGSGKTEVYLRAIEEVVRRGQEAIVLVPEIALTPQTIERFACRGTVAVLHSHLTDAERGGYWRRIANGHAEVVVGARSAVFAPTRKLGLIVIDEEHETSFKQEATPRYHARDVALMRARLAGVPIILGSATPSLESWTAAASGEFATLSLPARVADRPLPPVKLIDMRHEPKPPGKLWAVGPTLERGMRNALKADGQVILLLNRRGFSTHVHCPGCGHVAQCINCDLSLTFHRTKAALVCHYCGWQTPPMTTCPACSQPAVRYQGLGTEKLQAEIEERFPDKVVYRMDSDTMSTPGSHRRVFDAFRDGMIHILVGTQMIAKGLDFPNVTLVGVVNADAGLHLPDFRAAERTFQLLAQVAGRTGRGNKGGQVLVQTYTPDHPCVALAAGHDYVGFAKQELVHRKEHRYPPYEKLARLIVRSESEDAASAFADALAGGFTAACQRGAGTGVRVLGPAECPVFKLNGYYRFHFQVQAAAAGPLNQVLREVLAVAKPPSGVEYQLDVDPYSML